MSGNILQIQNVLNELPDDSWFYAVYAGKDYKIKGSTIKTIVPNISLLQTITDNTLNTSSKTVPGAINEVNTLAKGLSKNRTFTTLTALDEWLAIPANVATLNVGDNLLIIALDTPDYWWDGTQKQILETSKYTFSNGLTNTNGIITLGGDISDITNINLYAGIYFQAISGSPQIFQIGGSNPCSAFNSYSNSLDIHSITSGYFRVENIGGLWIDSNGNKFIDNRTTKKGLEYDGDYSANYTDRSLVDKAYVIANKFDLSSITQPIKTGKHVYNPSISVPFASSITLDLSTGALFDIAQLTGPITLNTINSKAGMTFLIRILQGTSAYTCTFGSTFVNNFGETAITTTVSKYTQIACSCFADGIIDYTISYQN